MAQRAYQNHLTPDNLYTLIEQSARTAVANARLEIARGYRARLQKASEK